MVKRKENLKDSSEKVLILDGIAYQNTDEFIIRLKPKEFEKKPLKFILERVEEPIILDNVTSNKVLEMFWNKHGLDAINDIIDDEKLSKDFYSLSETPSDIL